jgi:hypothetical protein
MAYNFHGNLNTPIHHLCGIVVRGYQIFGEVVDMERVLLSLVNTIKELLGRKGSGSGLESREYDRRDPSR